MIHSLNQSDNILSWYAVVPGFQSSVSQVRENYTCPENSATQTGNLGCSRSGVIYNSNQEFEINL
jgi:hypothetical protein